ncbi:hypothetical protein EBN03_16530 [Nocardia stercoris]|uniref:Novel STAND NTPase 1 domain-containing protein n=2 Tax=Nocardia stercoris TaxID=2483361 RepID=A0A3M2L5I9_9NOCA|nr:hypothetical protein EBN03_16530 [Nocardia stercoris]
MRAAQGNRPGGASAQRISDWKAGRNVPARFESLLPVVLVLVELARKRSAAVTRPLADPAEWQRLWRAATTWAPESEAESPCPYLGLTSYRPQDRALFFGRTQATTELTALVAAAESIVAVIGASGAGKSSLLAAGLIPALSDWETVTFTPGADPLGNLSAALAGAAPDQADPVSDTAPDAAAPEAVTSRDSGTDRVSTPSGAGPAVSTPDTDPAESTSGTASEPAQPPSSGTESGLTAGSSAASSARRRLLVIDQFEELFTACTDNRARDEFLTLLDGYASHTEDPITVVVAMRADFYAHCLDHPVLRSALEQRSFLLGPMRMDELAQAISGPAKAAGLELEPGLEELVVTELCGAGNHADRPSYDPGALPLLSHVMAATWQHREGRRLTVAGYRKAGGVVGSVAETAENAWNELTPAQQRAAQDILLGLVTVGRDDRDTRRTAGRADLLDRAADPEDATAALEILSRTRLITLDAESVTLTHEIVLTAWPRLRGWIDQDRVGYLIRQRLESDAADWDSQQRDPSLLYRGTRLQQASEHAGSTAVAALAREFLTAATTAHSRTRKRSSRTKAVLAVLGVALLLLGSAVYSESRLAAQRRADSAFAAVLAEADQKQATDPALAAQLDLVAWRMRPGDSDVRSRLLKTQKSALPSTVDTGDPYNITEIRRSQDGKLMASLSASNGRLRLWDTSDALRPHLLGPGIDTITAMDLSPDGSLMITTAGSDAADSRTTLWDVSTPSTPRRLSDLSGPSESPSASVAFAPDGKSVAVSRPSRLELWNVTDPGTPTPIGAPAATAANPFRTTIVFSPHGGLLAAVEFDRHRTPSTTIQLWDTTAGGPVLVAPSVGDPLTVNPDLAFSSDGAVLAVADTDPSRPTDQNGTTVQLWNVADPAHPRKVSTVNPGSGRHALAFAPGAAVLATAGTDGATLWNIEDPATPVHLTDALSMSPALCAVGTDIQPCMFTANSIEFGPDGRTLAMGGSGGEIRVWSLPPAVLTDHSGAMSTPAFDAAGDRMATVSDEGRVRLWSIRNSEQPQRIGEYQVPAGHGSITMSPDGSTLLLQRLLLPDYHWQRTLLDLTDPGHIHPLGDWDLPQATTTASISPDWRMLATSTGDHAMQLWDLSDRLRPKPIGVPFPTAPTASATFGPGNRTLLTQEQILVDRQARTSVVEWNISDPTHPQRVSELYHETDRTIGFVSIGPDQSATVVSRDAIQSWDISGPSPRRIGKPLVADTFPVIFIGIDTDGRTVATNGFDGAVQLWDFHDRRHPERIADLTGSEDNGSWTVALTPDGRGLATASRSGDVRFFDLDLQHTTGRICVATGSMWTEDLWHRYLPGFDYAPPCH